jgi:hypothetical protein
MLRPSTSLLILLITLLTLPLACATRVIERQVHMRDGITTTLRHTEESGVVVDRGYQHPLEISQERLFQILSFIRIRREVDGELEVKPAVAARLLIPVARGLSEALAAANSSEEIALTAVRRDRYLAIFTEKYLTSFVSFANDDLLTISFSRIEWDTDRGKMSPAKRDRLPQPHLGEKVMDFSIVPNEAYEATGEQSVRIRWSDERWNDPKAPDEAAGDADVQEATDEQSTEPPNEQSIDSQ